VNLIYSALLERLSVTAWGNMPWTTRKARCKHFVAQQERSGQRSKVSAELLQSWRRLRLKRSPDAP
jgi:hypothetical protein